MEEKTPTLHIWRPSPDLVRIEGTIKDLLTLEWYCLLMASSILREHQQEFRLEPENAQNLTPDSEYFMLIRMPDLHVPDNYQNIPEQVREQSRLYFDPYNGFILAAQHDACIFLALVFLKVVRTGKPALLKAGVELTGDSFSLEIVKNDSVYTK